MYNPSDNLRSNGQTLDAYPQKQYQNPNMSHSNAFFAYQPYQQPPRGPMYAQRQYALHGAVNKAIPSPLSHSHLTKQPMKMGIKSGMTVEELKRLTQQRIQSSNKSGQKSPMAVNNSHARHDASPTSARPTPSTPVLPKLRMSVQELKQLTVLRLASQKKEGRSQSRSAMSYNGQVIASKYPYHDGVSSSAAPRHGENGLHLEQGMSNLYSADAAEQDMRNGMRQIREYTPMYSADPRYEEVINPLSSDEEQEEKDSVNPLRFSEDAFPPPPDHANGGRFPSWSPPPARSKKLDTIAPPPTPFYIQQFHMGREYESRDQNAIIAPPPGLVRRPSMTVPWQVAEAVLNTPQTSSARKTLLSPTLSRNGKRFDPVSLSRGNSNGLRSPVQDPLVSLSSISAQLIRQRSGAAAANAAQSSHTLSDISSAGSQDSRKGSFGNAAEFFKFRRRSKSRLELAHESVDPKAFAISNTAKMPGIDEQEVSQQEYRDPDGRLPQRSYANAAAPHDFMSFYQVATGFPGYDPPPPPPPIEEDSDHTEDDVFSVKNLPMMSPNGVRLRKVAEMARRGSLSKEDKTRAKEEIIQHSLGMHANQAAEILSSKKLDHTTSTDRTERPAKMPPPGFHQLAKNPSSAFATQASTKHISTLNNTLSLADTAVKIGIVDRDMLDQTKSASLSESLDGISIQDRLRSAAQQLAECISQGKLLEFQDAIKELDALRDEAASAMRL